MDRRFIFGEVEKRRFAGLLRRMCRFTGVRCLTYCVMSNHFHLLLAVCDDEGRDFVDRASDEELLGRLAHIYGPTRLQSVREELERAREAGQEAADEVRHRYLSRMYDLSVFMKELKARFTRWHNRRAQRCGTLWEDRFRSVLVEGCRPALHTVAAYIDLNPVRARLVERPEAYPFSGLGEAVGGGREARAGLAEVVAPGEARSMAWRELVATYLGWMDVAGSGGGAGGADQPDSTGASPHGGKARRLPLAALLRFRIRYFTAGFAIGRATFLDEVFSRWRTHFGPRRRRGPKPMGGGDWGGLMSLRSPRDAVAEPFGH